MAVAQIALSNILSAEGEKLKELIASIENIDEFLAINQAVNRTIIHATFQEQALFYELEKMQGICGDCKPKCKEADPHKMESATSRE